MPVVEHPTVFGNPTATMDFFSYKKWSLFSKSVKRCDFFKSDDGLFFSVYKKGEFDSDKLISNCISNTDVIVETLGCWLSN